MRHISESIIGRKGNPAQFNTRVGLRQGDIVYLYKYPDTPFMYISDPIIISRIFDNGRVMRVNSYDYSEGIFFYYDKRMYVRFMLLSEYDDNLTFKSPAYKENYDVTSVWRGNIIIDPNDNIYELLKESNLKALVKSYKKIR